jgi:hypothetical protein
VVGTHREACAAEIAPVPGCAQRRESHLASLGREPKPSALRFVNTAAR